MVRLTVALAMQETGDVEKGSTKAEDAKEKGSKEGQGNTSKRPNPKAPPKGRDGRTSPGSRRGGLKKKEARKGSDVTKDQDQDQDQDQRSEMNRRGATPY
jgi:hypothetical protein